MEQIFDPREFGAAGDGKTLDTQAIQAAIDAAAKEGRDGKRSVVCLKAGTYLTSSLFLKSHMEFRMEDAAVLLGTTEEEQYPIMRNRVAGIEMDWPVGILNVMDQEDVQITGEGFDQKWAQQSVKLLCHQGRKVFYGNNLFAKGACIAGKDRLEDKKLKGYRYLSDSLVAVDVGMDMRVMGSPAYYPLIENGSNWYECSASCELILDDTSELVFVVGIPEETEKKRVAMALDGLPKRPNRTSRLSLTLKYVSPRDCEITVKDLGFGEMYPSSGKIWRELVRWDEQEERNQA